MEKSSAIYINLIMVYWYSRIREICLILTILHTSFNCQFRYITHLHKKKTSVIKSSSKLEREAIIYRFLPALTPSFPVFSGSSKGTSVARSKRGSLPLACLFDELQLFTSCTGLSYSPPSSPRDLYIKDFMVKSTACSTDTLSGVLYCQDPYAEGTHATLESPVTSEDSSEVKNPADAPYSEETFEYSDATIPLDDISATVPSRESHFSPANSDKGPHLTITLAYPHEASSSELCSVDAHKQDDTQCHMSDSYDSDNSQEHTIPSPGHASRVPSVSPTPPVVSVDLYIRPQSPEPQPAPPVHTSYSNYTAHTGPIQMTPSTLPCEFPHAPLTTHDRNKRKNRTRSGSPIAKPAECSEVLAEKREDFINSYPPIRHLYLPHHSSSLSYRPPLLPSQYESRREAESRNVPAGQARTGSHEETFRQVLQRHRES